MEIVISYFVAIYLSILYLTPAILAVMRNHKDSKKIFISSVLVNWTVVGWFINLRWSAKKREDI